MQRAGRPVDGRRALRADISTAMRQ